MKQPFASTLVVRHHLVDGLWIDVKEELSYGDKRALRRALLKYSNDPEQINICLMELALVAWSLDTPISGETIDRLQEGIVNQMLLFINTQYRPHELAEEEKKT